MDDVEIGRPLPALPAEDPRTETSYSSSLCLVRLHGKPLGLVHVDLPPTGLPADALAARIQAELAEEIARHLADDGLPPCELDADGITWQNTAAVRVSARGAPAPTRPPCRS